MLVNGARRCWRSCGFTRQGCETRHQSHSIELRDTFLVRRPVSSVRANATLLATDRGYALTLLAGTEELIRPKQEHVFGHAVRAGAVPLAWTRSWGQWLPRFFSCKGSGRRIQATQASSPARTRRPERLGRGCVQLAALPRRHELRLLVEKRRVIISKSRAAHAEHTVHRPHHSPL